MKDKCPVTFVNAVSVAGFQNGVVNIALNTFGFTPMVDDEGKAVVATDDQVTANLRMDLFCAEQLRDHLDRIIKANTKPAPEQVN